MNKVLMGFEWHKSEQLIYFWLDYLFKNASQV